MRKFFVAFALCVGMIAGGAARAENNCTGATYYDADTDTCVACPVGYDYNTDSGKTDITQCQIHCDAGTYDSGYTRLEYIESTGTQWIDTRIAVNSLTNPTIETSFMMKSSGDLDWFGTSNAGAGTIIWDIAGDGSRYIRWGTTASRNIIGGGLYFSNTLRNLKITGLKEIEIYVDGKIVAYGTKNSSAVMTSSLPILISRGRNIAPGRWATFKIENDGRVVFDGVASRRKSDGALGMYDNVSGNFFTNAGSGNFIAGPDIDVMNCKNVGRGYWSGASTINYGSIGVRNKCPSGTYSNMENAASLTDCTGCIGATYYSSVTDSCVDCPNGYDWNMNTGKTSMAECQVNCAVGTWNVGEYKKLKYIESSGTQWIDTKIPVNTLVNPSIETSFQMLSSGDFDWFGTNSVYAGTILWDVSVGNNTTNYIRWGTVNPRGFNVGGLDFRLPNRTLKITGLKQTSIFIDGELVGYNENSDAILNNSGNLLIGRGRNVPSGRWATFKIEDDGKVIFDGIAAQRNIDNAIGMYDTVTGQFFTNSGTGEFIAGPIIDSFGCVGVGLGYYGIGGVVNYGETVARNECPVGKYSDIENASACQPCPGATYNNKTAAASCIACPDGYDYNTDSGKTDITQCQIHCDGGTWNGEYTQLEYIESSGAQWINTGILPVALVNPSIETSFQMLSSGNFDWFGNIDATGGVLFNTESKGTFFFWGTSGWVPDNRKVDFNNAIHSLKVMGDNDVSVYVDGGLFGHYKNVSVEMTNSTPILIGRGRNVPSGRWAAFRIEDGGVAVFYGVAARRDSDGVLGLYDMVTGQFFTNSGTGEFIAGPDVGSIGACVNVGAGYWAAASTVNFGDDGARNACPVGTTTVGYGHGADSANDCGRVLHIGDYVLYARRDRVTSPSLNIRIPEEGIIYYINLGSENHDLSRLQLMLDGVQYTAYDDSLYYGERDFDTGEQITQ